MARAVQLECHIGMASRTVDIPAGFRDMPEFLRQHFARGSLDAIELVPVNRVHEPALVGEDVAEVDALDLHRCAAALTGNEPGQGRVSRIALVLADRYRFRRNILGVMFDRGRATEDDPNDSPLFVSTPREGCAIFLGAIRDLRSQPAEFDREVEFTAVHEVGHLFNLGHYDRASNFMATSKRNRPYPNEYFAFLKSQQDWLVECATSSLVHPGGSAYDPVSSFNAVSSDKNTRQSRLSLKIGVASDEFPCAAPVELDVKLLVKGTKGSRCYVPDRLDPGYQQFRIWVTHPNGERRLFRSPRRYCAPTRRILVSREHPRGRDISIFDGADGATFAKPGEYQLQAEFDLGPRGCLVSNRLFVRAAANHQCLEPERRTLLTNDRVRRFLYYRNTKAGPKVMEALIEHLQRTPGGRGANDIRYALVRAMARPAELITAANKQVLREHIQRIQDGGGRLGERQYHHLNELSGQL